MSRVESEEGEVDTHVSNWMQRAQQIRKDQLLDDVSVPLYQARAHHPASDGLSEVRKHLEGEHDQKKHGRRDELKEGLEHTIAELYNAYRVVSDGEMNDKRRKLVQGLEEQLEEHVRIYQTLFSDQDS